MTASYAITKQAPRPHQRAYRPYGAALDLFYYHGDEVALEGPAGTGKSRACLEKIHLCALKYPGMRALITRKTRESMSESVLVTFEEKVLPVLFLPDGPKRNQRQHYHYPNGSEIVVGGLDKPSKIMSTEYDLIYIAEATEALENDYESLTTRLRNGVMPYQQIIADCNPDAPTHWLHLRCDQGRAKVFFSRHEDNPTVTAAYLARLDNLTGVRKERLRYGRRAAAEGMVYEGFDRAVHLIDSWQVPDVRRYIASVDWGFTNPGVIQVWAIDGDKRMYLVHEIYMSHKTIDWWIPEAKALHARYRLETLVCDPAEPAFIQQFKRAGLPARKANNKIALGIQKAQERLKIAADNRPRIFFARDSLAHTDPFLEEAKHPLSTVQEIDSYLWPKGIDGKAIKEVPVDAYNHGMDCVRYACLYLDKPPGDEDDDDGGSYSYRSIK